MHLPFPIGPIWRRCVDGFRYFKTGIAVEGVAARLCEDGHGPLVAIGDEVISDRLPQHIDVEVRFWNRRGGRVTVIEVAETKILSRLQPLAIADWAPFEPATLEEGAAPVTREFVLVPKNDPQGRVEVSTGEVLELRFRPSRGSERWAQPHVQMHLETRR